MIGREEARTAARYRRRRRRIRKKIKGTAERPRLAVSRSAKHIYAQVIDDARSATIAFVGSTGKNVEGKTKTEKAKWVGTRIAELAKEKGVEKVVFDRGGRKYHGRIKAVADSAREAGLEF